MTTSRHSSTSSARVRRSVTSPKASNPLSGAPRPTERMTLPFDSRSTVATWLASSAGRRRDGGVSIVPSRRRDVRTAARPSEIHASTPHTGSHTNSPSQPASSATAARSAIRRRRPTARRIRTAREPLNAATRADRRTTRTRVPLSSTMDFELPPADDPRRVAVREWIAEHPEPSGEELARGRLRGAAVAAAVGTRR